MSIKPEFLLNALAKSICLALLWLAVAVLWEGSCFAQQSDTITYTYDTLNRLTRVDYAIGTIITYTYDPAGNRLSMQITSAAPSILRIDAIVASAGRTSGGQQIVLNGAFPGLASVTMGGAPASFVYTNGPNDTSKITITTPAHAAGAVLIDLTPSSGTGFSKPNAFAYLPTVFTDDAIAVNVTTAKAQHIIELRQAVDALRAVAGLGPAPWNDQTLFPGGTNVKAIHIQELRMFLDDVATRLGFATQPYTDPGLTTGYSIKRVHIEELRQRIRAIAG
jgi:YD repeat-containing protein